MKLKVQKKMGDNWLECTTDLTTKLNFLTNLKSLNTFYRKHYILIDNLSFIDRQFAIRVPGETVGYVKLDKDNKIRRVFIYPDVAKKAYPRNINRKLLKYIGKPFELPEEAKAMETFQNFGDANEV